MPSSYWKHPIIVVFCPITRLSNGVCSLITLRTCHCEERTKWPTRQSTAYNGGVRISAVRLLVHSGSPRATPSRWQNVKWWDRRFGTPSSLSLRGGTQVSDAAIHSMQSRRTDKCGSLSETQWIATGFQPSRWQKISFSLPQCNELPFTYPYKKRKKKHLRLPCAGKRFFPVDQTS